MWTRCGALLAVLLLLAGVVPLSTARAATIDQAVPGGWWYSQTGVPLEAGFALVDDGQARFWSEFRRLGGVDALGYPVSQRFVLDGFTVQATQRVIMQWRPESSSVQFVNVFDRLHDLGQDGWLQSVRQTPPPATFQETGKPWDQIVRDRLALLDAQPAIKARYLAAVGDPIEANGLPTTPVTDVGNHYALRAQRVVFQFWKETVPWASAGEVTVALGGDIAKEVGLVPASATRPSPPLPAPAMLGDPTAIAAPGAAVARPSPTAAQAGGSSRPDSTSTPTAESARPSSTATPAAGAAQPSPTAQAPDRPLGPDPNGPTAPIGGAPARFLPGAGEVAGARVVDDVPISVDALARGRPDPVAYAERLGATGFVRGHRRAFVRNSGTSNASMVAAEVDLFRDAAAAQAYWRDSARDGWASPEPGTRLIATEKPALGDDAAAFRIVSGDSAGKGFLILFRRANAVGWVASLGLVELPTLESVAALARGIDGRLR